MQLSKLKDYAGVNDMVRRPPVIYRRLRKLFATAETWDRSERESWLQARRQRVLDLARKLPGYRPKPPSLDASYQLKRVDLVGHERDFGRPGLLPAFRTSTGGTTGVPLQIRRSPLAIAVEQATIDHICALAGLDLRLARIAVLRGDFVKPPSDTSPPYWRAIGPNKLVLSSFHLSQATLSHYFDALRAYAPLVLMCYPSALAHLLGLMENSRHSLTIGYVLASSECLMPETVRAAQRLLGARVINHYGQAERVTLAYAIDDGPYLFAPLYGAADLEAGESGSPRILGTSLWNDRQIFIRYDTGDLALLPPLMSPSDRRDIELGLRGFFGIDGRVSEHVDLADGRRIIALNHIPRGVRGIASLQLQCIDTRVIEAHVVPVKGYGPESEAKISQNFYEKFPLDVALHIRKVDAPIRLPSGKAPLLVPTRDDAVVHPSPA
jgi:phenylacetate-CoA ligase